MTVSGLALFWAWVTGGGISALVILVLKTFWPVDDGGPVYRMVTYAWLGAGVLLLGLFWGAVLIETLGG